MPKRTSETQVVLGVVTPSPRNKQARIVSKDDESSPLDNESSARRNIFGLVDIEQNDRGMELDLSQESLSLPHTQVPNYTPDCSAAIPEKTQTLYGTLEDVYGASAAEDCFKLQARKTTIGRHPDCDFVLEDECISRKHCELYLHGDNTCSLIAVKKCWVYPTASPKESQHWEEVPDGTSYTLFSGYNFRLQPPSDNPLAQQPGQEFQIKIAAGALPEFVPNPGTHSFDHQYMTLLRDIKLEGEEQTNKKGPSLTLRRHFTISIDLSDEHDRYLLPLTSLRSMYGGRPAIVEAMWYLRGENHVRFLQENNCKFWDKQCKDDGYIGLNYGLLTNFPQDNGGPGINQLEEQVLDRLCKVGAKSRNMVCTLIKPGEPTEQAACTSSIQFSVSNNEYGDEVLDLNVCQRSSDTIVGLPHDVVVWSIILHLVRREVFLRTNGDRNLLAGRLVFSINAGGAHVYCLNEDTAQELLQRQPFEACQPFLRILGCDSNGRLADATQLQEGMFSLAKEFHAGNLRVVGYTKFHAAIRVKQAV